MRVDLCLKNLIGIYPFNSSSTKRIPLSDLRQQVSKVIVVGRKFEIGSVFLLMFTNGKQVTDSLVDCTRDFDGN